MSLSIGLPGTRGAAVGTAPSGVSRLFLLSGLDRLSKASGLIALAVSTIQPSIQAWHALFQKPNTNVTNTSPSLDFVYDPVERLVEYRFKVMLKNDGSEDDTLGRATASLERTHEGLAQSLAMTDVTAATPEGEQGIPIAIRLGPNPLVLSAFSALTPATTDILRGIGKHRLVVELETGGGKKHSLRYCFELADSVATGLFDSETRKTRTFLGASRPGDVAVCT